MRTSGFLNFFRLALASALVVLFFGCGGSSGGGSEIPELSVVIDSPAADASINEGETVPFQATVSGGSAPYAFEWTFGGGADGSSDEDPGAITFLQPGTYTCTLTVTDAYGSTGSASITVNVAEVVVDLVPTATITRPSATISIYAGDTVNFRGSATSGDSPLTYTWSFPGGTPRSSSLQNPGNVTFNTVGTYTCTLTVTDEDGDTDSDTVRVTVTAPDLVPTATITRPSANISINAGDTVNFRSSATGGNGALTYAWSFPGGSPASSTAEDPGNVTFTAVGTYTCTLTVTDADGDTDNDSVTVTVIAVDLIPSATIDSPAGDVSINQGEAVTFQGSATGGDGALTYAWSFPGGTPASSTAEDPGNVTFTAVGTYTCTLTVTDTDGDTDSDSVTVTVVDLIPTAAIDSPTGDISISEGDIVTFQGSGSGGDGTLTYAWSFPGGTPASSTIEDPGGVTFTAAGTYTCTLTVNDTDGDTDSDSVTVTVIAVDLIPSATIDSPAGDVSINEGEAVTFQGSGSGGDGTLTYAWSFPGGTPASSTAEDPGDVTFIY